MSRSTLFFPLAVLAVAFSPACSSSSASSNAATDAGADSVADAPPSSPTFSMKLKVPADFKGEPRQLVVGAFRKLPVTGPPDGGFVVMQDAPKLVAGATFTATSDASGVKGDYYLVVIVFTKGGGTYSPMEGVDWDAVTAKTVGFDGAHDVEGGELTLAAQKKGNGILE